MFFKKSNIWISTLLFTLLTNTCVIGFDYHASDYHDPHHHHNEAHEHEKDQRLESSSKYKIVCYYTVSLEQKSHMNFPNKAFVIWMRFWFLKNWSQYRDKPYFPENVDPTLCTHVIFAFAKINANSVLETYEWNDESSKRLGHSSHRMRWQVNDRLSIYQAPWSKGMYERTVALKLLNKDLKVMLAVGGKFLACFRAKGCLFLKFQLVSKDGTIIQSHFQ